MNHDERWETIMQDVEALLEMADRAEEQGDITGMLSYRQEAEERAKEAKRLIRYDAH